MFKAYYIKGKVNDRTLKERLNHSSSSILAAALFGCFGLLASCTAGDDSLDYGTDAGANIKTASNVSVQQSSSDRITLFKTSGTRAVTRSEAQNLTMPDEPTDAELSAAVSSSSLSWEAIYNGGYWGLNPNGKAILVEEGKTLNYANLPNNTTVYVKGTYVFAGDNANGNVNSNLTIYVLEGGTLTGSTCLNGVNNTVYNYGGTVKQEGDFASTCTYMTTGDFKQEGKVRGTLYVGGNLTTDTKQTENQGCHIYVGGNAIFNDQYNMSGGSMYVDGTLTATTCELGTGTTWTVGCSATFSEKLYLNSGSTMELSGYGYISSPTTKLDSDGKITINGGGCKCFLSLGDLEINNGDNGLIDVTGANGHATVVTNSLKIGGNLSNCVTFSDTNSDYKSDAANIDIFRCGTNASMDFYFNTPVKGDNNWANVTTYDFITNVTPYVNSTSVPETPTSCSSNTEKEPTDPTIDDIAVIENIDHKHVLSATCVDWNSKNNKVYVSWHARGTGQAGCLEVFDHSNAEQPSLVSYMQAWTGDTLKAYSQNDTLQYIDYNHCIYDEAQNRLYAVGNCNAVGGQLSYISLGSDGTFDDSKEYDEYSNTEDITNNGVLKYIALNKGDKKSCDGNCVIRQGDNFLVASTSGFETFDASKLTSTKFVPSEGKGKHIATDGTNVLTLNYNRFIGTGEDKSTPLQAVVKSYAASDAATFSNANIVIDATETIAPNDGKNTIVVDGNYAYVCLSENGLVIYDLNGNKINSFVKDKVTIQGVEVAGGLCNGVAVDDDYIYVAYGSFGLYVFDKAKVLNGETMEPVTSYKCSKSCNYIKVVDRDSYHYLYIAYGEQGLRVCRIAKKNA